MIDAFDDPGPCTGEVGHWGEYARPHGRLDNETHVIPTSAEARLASRKIDENPPEDRLSPSTLSKVMEGVNLYGK